jgi:GntR family transcriptional regulator
MRDMPAKTATVARPVRGNAPRRVRRDLPVPYYAQLAEILHEEITDGVWVPGDELPSEAELCATHGVSRTAVRQALGELATRGVVHKQRGRRTSVAGVTSLVVQEMRGFSDEMQERGEEIRTEILKLEIVPAPPRVAHDLNLPNGSDVVLLARAREVDHETVVYTETHLPASRFRELLDIELAGTSLYAALSDRFGVHPRSGRRAIEAVGATREIARLLHVKAGAALLKLHAVNLDEDGAPFETFEAWYRGDATRFELVVGP